MPPLAQRLAALVVRARPQALNQITISSSAAASPTLAADLKSGIQALHAQGLEPQMGRVDYVTLRHSSAYADYRALTAQLVGFDLPSLTTPTERRAFWLNIYNALVLDAVIYYGLERIPTWLFLSAGYQIGGYFFHLDDIEHGVLRANRGHPLIPGRHFRPNDPRRAFALTQLDPRLHFALVCGAASCPPIRFYQAEQLDGQLTLAARSFLAGPALQVDLGRQTVTLSKILDWYKADFGATWPQRLATLAHYLPHEHPLHELLATSPPHIKVRFSPYDWAVNGV
jgi:hypothetical protein